MTGHHYNEAGYDLANSFCLSGYVLQKGIRSYKSNNNVTLSIRYLTWDRCDSVPALALAVLSAASARADTYSWTNFQSDIPGVAQHVDLNLVNPWGMSVSPNGTIWVSDNGTGVSTLYRQDGTAVSLVVEIPTAARNRGVGNPTGQVFNGTPFFQVTKNGNSAPAFFIFVSGDGSISGWNPTLDQTHAIIAVDYGTNRGRNSAIYKGATPM